ncbi:hypothetical protein Tco_0443021 [Tanacetum coccineum]
MRPLRMAFRRVVAFDLLRDALSAIFGLSELKPFETDESTATPPPPPAYYTTSRMFVRSQAPIPFPAEAEIPLPLLLIPSISITSPTYTEAPLGYRADGIRLRAASPLPLPAPSTSRRADIPEADILPQKRLLLTIPTPRFEVGESYAAAVRQSGSTVAHRVDYSFVDTVDASIRALERRTMAAIEMLNLRRDHAALRGEVDTLRMYISSMCTTYEHERFEVRQALARSEAHNKALETQITVLETQAHRHKWKRQDTDDHATRSFVALSGSGGLRRINHFGGHWLSPASMKMPPKRNATTTTTTPMTNAQIKALISQGVANALAKRDADRSRNGDDSHDLGSDRRRRMPIARECTYSDFLKCQPLSFKGTEGVVGLT